MFVLFIMAASFGAREGVTARYASLAEGEQSSAKSPVQTKTPRTVEIDNAPSVDYQPAPPPPIAYPPPPAPPPAPPGRFAPKAATPKGNPGNWITMNDYPTRALRSEEEGTTRFRLTVGVTGLVESCIVTYSSGSSTLDEATCTLLQRRARFNPAIDGAGNPAVGAYSSAVRWMIPRDPPPLPGTETMTYVIDELGNPQDCRFTDKEGNETVNGGSCYLVDKVQPYLDKNGAPVRHTVTVKMVTTIDSAP